MLIDAAHAEEVRVCVLENRKVEDFDFESSSRKPLRGNIYLARVTRVEPSLQAAFVEYGGNRHGFLAFSEIHPDYYQIPVSDREALQAAEAEEAALAAELDLAQRGDDEDENGDHSNDEGDESQSDDAADEEISELADTAEENTEDSAEENENTEDGEASEQLEATSAEDEQPEQAVDELDAASADDTNANDAESDGAEPDVETEAAETNEQATAEIDAESDALEDAQSSADGSDAAAMAAASFPFVTEETDTLEDRENEESSAAEEKKSQRRELLEKYREAKRHRAKLVRNYKIQEVIKRRQILLIQVVKEERGNKGAALTTYMSLAGRYCVLMPNTARGGGISRKIPSATDRKRLRRVVDSLDVSQGMGLIIRTAGAKRTKIEIKRDYDYLTRLWETIRELTLESIAPCLIYEEASLIKRAIRDLYDKDISKVIVEGEDGYREAKDFMKMLMPSHAKHVQPYKDKSPLFIKHDVETQLDAMYQPTVRLKSGGYLVINQTEALIAVDVNSGKATRERNIELTALKTNIEAAAETARQCRLRDLAGLIVIDFIDMEENKNNRAVEKKLKEALKHDRARIQVGRISNFGLLEMSRQRRRSGIIDGTTNACPTCLGAGAVRSDEMAALRILRAIESNAIAGRAATIAVRASLDVTLFVLNHKRDWLKRLETDHALTIEVIADEKKHGDQYEIEKRGVARPQPNAPSVIQADMSDTIGDDANLDDGTSADTDRQRDEEAPTRKRRRRRRKKRSDQDGDTAEAKSAENDSETNDNEASNASDKSEADGAVKSDNDDNQDSTGEPKKRRRRGRRGGRKKTRRDSSTDAENGESQEQPVAASSEKPSLPKTSASATNAEPKPAEKPASSEPKSQTNGKKAAAAPAPKAEPAPKSAETAPTEAKPAPTAPSADEVAERVKNRKPSRKGWWSRALGG